VDRDNGLRRWSAATSAITLCRLTSTRSSPSTTTLPACGLLGTKSTPMFRSLLPFTTGLLFVPEFPSRRYGLVEPLKRCTIRAKSALKRKFQ
jgi:hypothetical protein